MLRKLVFLGRVLKVKKRISDIDILVEFKRDGETFDNYMELKFFFREIAEEKSRLSAEKYLEREVIYV
mgnify:CR=1 FL=1